MKNIIKIAILSMVLINCGSDNNGIDNSGSINNDGNINDNSNNPPTTFESQNIEFTTIIKEEGTTASRQQGSIFDNGNQNIVFTNSSEWESFLNEFQSYELSQFTEIDVDFTTYQIIVVIDDKKQTGGWSIEITSITEFENEINVVVVTSDMGNDTTIMTQPYHIVKMPISSKPINFEVEEVLL